ncbi:MAG: hypothetical protein OXU22_03125 [Gammaproteobacteria bacterium]|nr:hypothetical protein [Gammaproteobacteria bacterium]
MHLLVHVISDGVGRRAERAFVAKPPVAQNSPLIANRPIRAGTSGRFIETEANESAIIPRTRPLDSMAATAEAPATKPPDTRRSDAVSAFDSRFFRFFTAHLNHRLTTHPDFSRNGPSYRQQTGKQSTSNRNFRADFPVLCRKNRLLARINGI